MPAETTPAVARALEAAPAFAAAAGTPAVGPRHVFAGLMADAEGRAAVWLVEHGLELNHWRQAQPNLPPYAGSGADVPFGPAAARTLDLAAGIARTSSEDHIITSDHLLLGVLAADPALRQELTEFGLRADDL